MAKILSTAIFKIVNLVALLGYLFNIISMFAGSNCYYGPDAAGIVNGVFHVFSWLALLYIEVDQSPMISNVVPFMFSFAGRGVFFMWLAWTTFTLSILSIIGSIFTFIVGVIYLFLFVLKNVKTPEHMSYDDTLFSGVSKYFADSDEGDSFLLPTHKNTLTDSQAVNTSV